MQLTRFHLLLCTGGGTYHISGTALVVPVVAGAMPLRGQVVFVSRAIFTGYNNPWS